MASILVTGAGGIAGHGAIQSILSTTEHTVIGADIDKFAAGLYMADKGVLVPRATDPEWPSAVGQVVQNHNIDLVCLMLDVELDRVSELRDHLPSDVALLAPRDEVIDICVDKLALAREFENHGLLTPTTVLASARDTLTPDTYPVIAKPRLGQGTADVDVLETPADVTAHLESIDNSPESIVLQEYIDGTEYTTSVVVTNNNDLLAVVPKETFGRNRRVTRKAPTVVEACEQIVEELKLCGICNIQHIVTEGTAYPIEINPRFSASSPLTVAAGVDEYALQIADALGENVSKPNKYEVGCHISRYRDQYVVSPDELVR